MANSKYIHGFSKNEQKRLIYQAHLLEPKVYEGLDYVGRNKLLEVGCGVGAQTKILCRRFPHLSIHSVDLSEVQLHAAAQYLKSEIKKGQVRLSQQDAMALKLDDAGTYDSAFICWFFEHVPDPLKVLKNIKKQLSPGARIYCSEVFNQTLYLEPFAPAFQEYWAEFNDLQTRMNGDPFVGAKLGNLLHKAGYKNIQLEVRDYLYDSRNPKARATYVEYFHQILLSGQDVLLREGRVTKALIQKMKAETKILKSAKDAIFFYAYIRATATVD